STHAAVCIRDLPSFPTRRSSDLQLYGPERFLLGPVHFVGFSPPGTEQAGTLQNVADPETTIEQLPNKNLAPEHDRTWTGGVVYTDRKSTRLNSSHLVISYAVFCL